MHLSIDSYLGEYSHQINTAGKMSTIPLVPKLEQLRKAHT